MTQFRAWLGSNLVPLLACTALVWVVLSWLGDAFYGIRPVGTLPLFYDIALAFLTGVVFQYLVVHLPERRRARETVQTHRGNLKMIANNGPDLIRELEFVGRCPQKEPTPDHIRLVATACNDNPATTEYMQHRLTVARERYRRLLPFLFALPHDVAVALERVEQSALNDLYFIGPVELKPLTLELDPLREPRPHFVPQGYESYEWRRKTLGEFAGQLVAYCAATQALDDALRPHLVGGTNYYGDERVLFLAPLWLADPGVPEQYPPEAYSTEWAGPEPTLPPAYQVRFTQRPKSAGPSLGA